MEKCLPHSALWKVQKEERKTLFFMKYLKYFFILNLVTLLLLYLRKNKISFNLLPFSFFHFFFPFHLLFIFSLLSFWRKASGSNFLTFIINSLRWKRSDAEELNKIMKKMNIFFERNFFFYSIWSNADFTPILFFFLYKSREEKASSLVSVQIFAFPQFISISTYSYKQAGRTSLPWLKKKHFREKRRRKKKLQEWKKKFFMKKEKRKLWKYTLVFELLFFSLTMSKFLFIFSFFFHSFFFFNETVWKFIFCYPEGEKGVREGKWGMREGKEGWERGRWGERGERGVREEEEGKEEEKEERTREKTFRYASIISNNKKNDVLSPETGNWPRQLIWKKSIIYMLKGFTSPL